MEVAYRPSRVHREYSTIQGLDDGVVPGLVHIPGTEDIGNNVRRVFTSTKCSSTFERDMRGILEEFHSVKYMAVECFAQQEDQKTLTLQLYQSRSKVLRSLQACARIQALALQSAHSLYLDELVSAVTAGQLSPGEERLRQLEEQEYIRRKEAIRLLIRPDVPMFQGVPEDY